MRRESLAGRQHLVVALSIALVALLAGGCSSVTRSAARAPRTAPPVSGPIRLVSDGGGAQPAGPSSGPAIFPYRKVSYRVDGTLPALGKTAVAWRMQPHQVDAETVEHFAQVIGLAARAVPTSTGWQAQGSDAVLSFDTTGSDVTVSYTADAPPYASGIPTGSGSTNSASAASTPPGAVASGPGISSVPSSPESVSSEPPLPTMPPGQAASTSAAVPAEAPDDAQSVAVARGMLDRLGVLSGEQWAASVSPAGAGIAVTCTVVARCPVAAPGVAPVAVPAVSAVSAVEFRTVEFTLSLGGVAVDGVTWSVTVGDHDRIESIYGEWATPASLGRYALRPVEAVLKDLQAGTATPPGAQPMVATLDAPVPNTGTDEAAPGSGSIPTVVVDVTGVTLGLALRDAYDGTRTVVDLVPTYLFRTSTATGPPSQIELVAID